MVDNLENEVTENNRAANAVWSGSVTRDLSDVRNEVILIGIDMFRSNAPVVTKFPEGNEPNPSVYPPPEAVSIWDATGGNHLGFYNRFVSIQNLFVDQDFTDQAGQSYFNIMSVPGIDSVITTWLQPDIYPEHRIGVADRRSGLYDIVSGSYLELMVTGVSHYVRKGFGQTTIKTRYVPPTVNPEVTP
jgi:hypothetical protein